MKDSKRDEIRRGMQRFKMQMMRQLPFYGDILMRVEIKEDFGIETAQTNGKMIRYNPVFMEKLNEGQRNYVLMHEVLHILLFHWKRRADREPELWNIACDYVVNGIIDRHILPELRAGDVKILIERPPQGCFVRWYYGEPADYFYMKLEKDYRNMIINIPEEAGGNSKTRLIQLDGKIMRLPSDLSGLTEMSNSEEQEIEGLVRELVRDTLKRRGTGGYYIPEQMIKLTETKRLPWHILLSDFLEQREDDESSYLTPERKYIHMDLIVPGLSKSDDKLGEIWAFVDSSGSVGEDEMNRFMTQLYRISKDFGCIFNIAFWDTKVSDVFLNVTDKNKVLECRPRHSGGTDINCIYDFIDKTGQRIDVMLILTDGYFGTVSSSHKADVNKLKKKTILVISENGHVSEETKEIGKVARL